MDYSSLESGQSRCDSAAVELKAVSRLSMVSLMADVCDPFYARLGEYLSERTQTRVRVIDGVDWESRERKLDSGEAEIGFVCGLQYLSKSNFELLAAPVWIGARYADCPVYFSDVIVAADSPYRGFVDIEGSVLAFNEPTSHSGCNLIRYHLAERGLTGTYFGGIVQSGSHRKSIEMIIRGEADVSAVDSTVLELEISASPEIEQKLRVIETLGPSPAPPAIISRRIPSSVREELQRELLTIHHNPAGRDLLALSRLSRLAAVRDSDYDVIRLMEAKAQSIKFP